MNNKRKAVLDNMSKNIYILLKRLVVLININKIKIYIYHIYYVY